MPTSKSKSPVVFCPPKKLVEKIERACKVFSIVHANRPAGEAPPYATLFYADGVDGSLELPTCCLNCIVEHILESSTPSILPIGLVLIIPTMHFGNDPNPMALIYAALEGSSGEVFICPQDGLMGMGSNDETIEQALEVVEETILPVDILERIRLLLIRNFEPGSGQIYHPYEMAKTFLGLHEGDESETETRSLN